MAVDLIKKWMDITQDTHSANSQTVKEKDLIVPDGKSDVHKILLLDGKIRIDQIDIQANRIVYQGQVDVTILYVPEGEDASIVKMSGTIPLEDFMIVEGLEPSDRVDFHFDIENIHFNLLNERKINVKVIIALDAVMTSTKEVSIVEDIKTDDNVQKKAKEVNIITMMPYKEEKRIIKENLQIPQNKPVLGEILKQTADIIEEQIKRTDDEIEFSCKIEVSTLYKSAEDEKTLEVVTHKIPVNDVKIDLARDENEAYITCELDIVPTYDPQISPDYDGEDRMIETEYILTAKYTTYNNEKTEIIDDIYCPGKKVNISSNNETYQNLIFKDITIASKKVNLNAEGLSPENNKIFTTEMKVKVEDKVLNGSILTIEGFVEILITYISENGVNKIGVFEDAIPFEISTPTAVSTGTYTINVLPRATDINVANFSKDNITLEYNLEFNIEMYDTNTLRIIDEIVFEDMTKEELSDYPSIIVYNVKPGENMWEIAKRFNTTVEEVAQINEFEKDTKLKGGEKVILIKKAKF